MGTVTAVKTGNWSDPTVWGTNPILPASGDTVLCGAYVVTMDQDIDIGAGTLTCRSTGYFAVASARNIVANILSDTGHSGGAALRATHTTGTVAIAGTAQAGPQVAVSNASAGTLNVTTATGGSGSGAYGAYNANAGTLNVTTATGGSGSSAFGAYNSSVGVLICNLAIGNDYGPLGTTANQAAGLFGANVAWSITRVKQVRYGAHGMAPTAGSVTLTPDPATNSAQFRRYDTLATITLSDAGFTADLPAVTDVRNGVSYDFGDMIGTAAIPAANQVAVGIPVDATVGTAVITAAAVANAVWDAQLGGHSTSGSAGAALSGLTGVPVSISSPIASDGTTINLIYGDDYAAADNRALLFASLSGPVLTGGTVALRVQVASGVVVCAATITGEHACYVEMTDTQIATIGIGVWRYDLEATLAVSGRTVTMAQGYMTVSGDVR